MQNRLHTSFKNSLFSPQIQGDIDCTKCPCFQQSTDEMGAARKEGKLFETNFARMQSTLASKYFSVSRNLSFRTDFAKRHLLIQTNGERMDLLHKSLEGHLFDQYGSLSMTSEILTISSHVNIVLTEESCTKVNH